MARYKVTYHAWVAARYRVEIEADSEAEALAKVTAEHASVEWDGADVCWDTVDAMADIPRLYMPPDELETISRETVK